MGLDSDNLVPMQAQLLVVVVAFAPYTFSFFQYRQLDRLEISAFHKTNNNNIIDNKCTLNIHP